MWDGRSIKSRGLGLLCMRISVIFISGSFKLFWGVAVLWSCLKLAKAYRDGRQALLGKTWSVHLERKRDWGTPLFLVGPPVPGLGARAGLGGRGDLIHGHRPLSIPSSSLTPVSFQPQADPISPFAIYHWPLTTHLTVSSHSRRIQGRSVCVTDSKSKMRCGRYGLMVAPQVSKMKGWQSLF